MDPASDNRKRLQQLGFGVAVGLLYGLSVRLAVRFLQGNSAALVMSVGFLFFLPFAMGFISVFLAERKQSQGIATWVLLPWFPMAGALAAMLLLAWEGFICVVMFAPLGLGLASAGGLSAGLIARRVRLRASQGAALACVALLPLLILPWDGERTALAHQELRKVDTAIDIHAPAAVVWKNIERVPAIRREELPSSWTQRIGFPDPIEATLSFEGVGGVRHASFTRGLLFLENVDVWEPEKRLAFSIHARTSQIPETTLDEHVRVGGQYFDVLRGEYRLEPLPTGLIRLHLSSQQRVSTDFNWYAHLWSDAIMADLQQRILHVVRERCEKAAL